MRFERFFAEAGAFAHQVGTYQTRDSRVNVHHGAAGEVQRAIPRKKTARPDHVRNRQICQRHPHADKNQHGGEADALGDGADDQTHGDTGERRLERHVDILIEAAHYRFQLDVFQHCPLEATEEGVAFAEGQRIAVHNPQHTDQCKRHRHLRQHREHVFAANQTAVKQRDPWNRHKQHQRGANHHKCVVGLIRYGRRSHRQRR